MKELLIQREFQIAAGYEDCNYCNNLRDDMVLKLCAGRLSKSDNELASQPTMSRLENTVTKTGLFRLFLHIMAYILIHTLQKQLLKGTEYANATMKTIQNKIIKTATWVKEMKTKIKIELPQFCPTKEEQLKGYKMLIMLRT